VTKIQKNSLPGVPRKGPEAGVRRRENNFHGSGLSRIDSCLFLHSHFLCVFFNDSDPFVNALYKKKCTGFFLLELPLSDILSNFTGNI
jgi:hypothetical protein